MTNAAPRLMGAYARDTVTWLQFQGLDDYGDPITPVEVSIPVRVTWEFKRVLDKGGNEVVSSGNITMASKPRVDQDKIRINGTEYIIVAAKELKSFSVVTGYRVYLQ